MNSAAPGVLPLDVQEKHFRDQTDQERADEEARCWSVCNRLAQEPDILDRAVSDLRSAGVVGEERVTHAVLLAGIARLSAKPVSLTVKGASSSGKSFTVR